MRATDHLLPEQPSNRWVIYNTIRGTVLHDSGLNKPWTTSNEKQARVFAEEYTRTTRELCVPLQVKEAIDKVLRHHGK